MPVQRRLPFAIFGGEAPRSRTVCQSAEKHENGGKSLGLRDGGRSLGVQGQTYTRKPGICCHEPIGSQMLDWKETYGRRGSRSLKGDCETVISNLQLGVTSSLRYEIWGEGNQHLSSRPTRVRGSCRRKVGTGPAVKIRRTNPRATGNWREGTYKRDASTSNRIGCRCRGG